MTAARRPAMRQTSLLATTTGTLLVLMLAGYAAVQVRPRPVRVIPIIPPRHVPPNPKLEAEIWPPATNPPKPVAETSPQRTDRLVTDKPYAAAVEARARAINGKLGPMPARGFHWNPAVVMAAVEPLYGLPPQEVVDTLSRMARQPSRGDDNVVTMCARYIFTAGGRTMPDLFIGMPSPDLDWDVRLPFEYPALVIDNVPYLLSVDWAVAGFPQPACDHVENYRTGFNVRSRPAGPAVTIDAHVKKLSSAIDLIRPLPEDKVKLRCLAYHQLMAAFAKDVKARRVFYQRYNSGDLAEIERAIAEYVAAHGRELIVTGGN